jgi:5-methylcytosine-specific restriction endonuclease McrA
MKGYSDSLRGYGSKTHEKNNFICQYCGYDGRDFPNWLQLSVDHIVPYSQGGLHDSANLITVCHACNSITSRMNFPKGTAKKEIIAAKKKRVKERQEEYFDFWKTHVKKSKYK